MTINIDARYIVIGLAVVLALGVVGSIYFLTFNSARGWAGTRRLFVLAVCSFLLGGFMFRYNDVANYVAKVFKPAAPFANTPGLPSTGQTTWTGNKIVLQDVSSSDLRWVWRPAGKSNGEFVSGTEVEVPPGTVSAEIWFFRESDGTQGPALTIKPPAGPPSTRPQGE